MPQEISFEEAQGDAEGNAQPRSISFEEAQQSVRPENNVGPIPAAPAPQKSVAREILTEDIPRLMTPISVAGRAAKGAFQDVAGLEARALGVDPEAPISNLASALSPESIDGTQTKSPTDIRLQQAQDEYQAQGKSAWPAYIAKGMSGMVESLPKIYALPYLGGSSLLGQSIAAGGLFGVGEDGQWTLRAGITGALMPGVLKYAGQGVSAAIAKGIQSGATSLEAPAMQKLVEIAGEQAALNAYTAASQSPELVQAFKENPEKGKEQLVEMALGNLVWSLFGASRLGADAPSHTEAFLKENAEKYGDMAAKMMSRRLVGKEGAAAIDDAIKNRRNGNFEYDPFHPNAERLYVPPSPGPMGEFPEGGTMPVQDRMRVKLGETGLPVGSTLVPEGGTVLPKRMRVNIPTKVESNEIPRNTEPQAEAVPAQQDQAAAQTSLVTEENRPAEKAPNAVIPEFPKNPAEMAALSAADAIKIFGVKRPDNGMPVYRTSVEGVLHGLEMSAADVPAIEKMRADATSAAKAAIKAGNMPEYEANFGKVSYFTGVIEGATRKGGNFDAMVRSGEIDPATLPKGGEQANEQTNQKGNEEGRTQGLLTESPAAQVADAKNVPTGASSGISTAEPSNKTPGTAEAALPTASGQSSPVDFTPEAKQKRMEWLSNIVDLSPGKDTTRWNAVENTYHAAKAAQEALPGVPLKDIIGVTIKQGPYPSSPVVDHFFVERSKLRDFTESPEMRAEYPPGKFIQNIQPGSEPYNPQKGEPSYQDWLKNDAFQKPEPFKPRRVQNSEKDRPFDIIDEIEGKIGKINPKLIREANPNWKPDRLAKHIFSDSGQSADTAADDLADGGMFKGEAGQPDQLGEAINRAARERRQHKVDYYVREKEQKAQAERDERWKRENSFVRQTTEPIKGKDFKKGDNWTLQGEKIRVLEVNRDESGAITSLLLSGGKKFGDQTISGVPSLRMDRGSYKFGNDVSDLFEPKAKPVDTPKLQPGETSGKLLDVAPDKTKIEAEIKSIKEKLPEIIRQIGLAANKPEAERMAAQTALDEASMRLADLERQLGTRPLTEPSKPVTQQDLLSAPKVEKPVELPKKNVAAVELPKKPVQKPIQTDMIDAELPAAKEKQKESLNLKTLVQKMEAYESKLGGLDGMFKSAREDESGSGMENGLEELRDAGFSQEEASKVMGMGVRGWKASDLIKEFKDQTSESELPATKPAAVDKKADAPAVPFSAGSKVHLRGPGGKWNNGTTKDGGDNLGLLPKPWTVLGEVTDPQFPDERLFDLQNDQTKEVQRGIAIEQLQPAKEKSKADREAGREKTVDDLRQELTALLKANPGNIQSVSDYIKDFKTKEQLREAIKRAKSESGLAANLGEGLPEGKGMSPEEARSAVSGVDTAGFGVETISKDQAEQITGRPEARGYGGFFYQGKVYLVHENMARRNVEGAKALLREEVGHGLLRTEEGLKQLQSVLDAGKLNLTESERQALLSQGYLEHQLLDEFIAKSAAQNMPWWKQAVEAVRVWLSKVGLANLSNEETARLLLKQIVRDPKAGEFYDAALPDLAPNITTPPGSPDDTRPIPEERRRYGQFSGVRNLGELGLVENIRGVQMRLRSTMFDATQPVTPTNTDAAWRIFNLATNPESRGAFADEVARLGSPNPDTEIRKIAPALMRSEVESYAVKMAAEGDDTMIKAMAEKSRSWGVISSEDNTGSAAGSALRGFREGKSNLFKALVEITKQKLALLGEKLGVGTEKMQQLLDTFAELKLSESDVMELFNKGKIPADPGEPASPGKRGRPARGPKTITEILDEMSPESKEAQSILDKYQRSQTEWLKPEGAISDIRRIIRDAISNGPTAKFQDQADFVSRVSELIQAVGRTGETDLMGNEEGGVPKNIADELAFEVWKDKSARESSKTAKLNEREARREQSNAEQLLDQWETERVDWVKNDAENQTKKAIKDAFKQVIGNEGGKVSEEQFKINLSDQLQSFNVSKRVADEIAFQALGRKKALDDAKLRREIEKAAKDQNELADKTAARLLADFQNKHSEVEWLKPDTKANEIREIIKKALKLEKPDPTDPARYEKTIFSYDIAYNPAAFTVPLRDRLLAAGVKNRQVAQSLAEEVFRERVNNWANARAQAQKRASQSRNINSLIESIKTSPQILQRDPVWRAKTAELWFESNGLSADQAKAASEAFWPEFEKAMVAAREREASRIMGKGDMKKLNDLLTAVRLGLTNPDQDWSDKLAIREGWKPLTREQNEKLARLEVQASDPAMSPTEISAVHTKMMQINRTAGIQKPKFMQAMAERYVSGMLSSIRTVMIQLSPMITSLRDLTIASASDPANAKNFATAVWRAYKENIKAEMPYAWQHEAYGFHLGDMDLAHGELERIWEQAQHDYEKGNLTQKAVARTHQLFALGRFTTRILNTADQTQMAAVREWKLVFYANDAFKAAGLSTSMTGDLIDAMVDARQSAFDRAKDAGLDDGAAKVRANNDMVQFVGEFMSNASVNEGLIFDALKSAENDVYLFTGRKAEGIKENDEGMASQPMNLLMETLSNVKGKGGWQSIMGTASFGFVNIPFRTLRFYSNFYGYGLLREGIDRYRTNHGKETFWKQSRANKLQAKTRFREALAGTAVMAAAAAWTTIYNTSDDKAGKEKFALYITGNGPQGRVMREEWTKAGWKPYALNFIIDGKKVVIPITRVGESVMPPFIIAASLDDLAWKKKAKAAAGLPFNDPVTQGVSTMIGEHFYMSGQSGFLQTMATLGQAVQGGQGFLKPAAKLVGGTLSAMVIPLKQALQSLSDMFYGPLDSSSASAIVANQFPVFGIPFQNKAVNRYGDDLYDRSWYGRIYNTGVPIAFQVSQTPDNMKMYPMLVEKGAAAPELRRYILEERYGNLTDGQFAQFAQISGKALKETVTSNYDNLKTQPPQQVRDFLGEAAKQADAEAAQKLGLEPVQRPSGASGGSPGASSSNSGPAAPAAGLPGARTGGISRSGGGISGSSGLPGGIRRPRVKRLALPRPKVSVASRKGLRLGTSKIFTTGQPKKKRFV